MSRACACAYGRIRMHAHTHVCVHVCVCARARPINVYDNGMQWLCDGEGDIQRSKARSPLRPQAEDSMGAPPVTFGLHGKHCRKVT